MTKLLQKLAAQLPPGHRIVFDTRPLLPCGKTFMSCADSTNEAEHRCVLPYVHAGLQHECQCGVRGDC